MASFHNSSSEDEATEDELKAPSNPSGIHFTEEDTQAYKEGWDDRDNNLNSNVYDRFNNGCHRYVSSTNHFAHIY